jgi:hypothetical protein
MTTGFVALLVALLAERVHRGLARHARPCRFSLREA